MKIRTYELLEYIAISFFILLLVGLIVYALYRGSIQPCEGVVIRKDYTPAYTSTTYRYADKGGESIRIPMQEYHAERYVVVIKGVNANGEEDTAYYYITPEEYRTINVGDYYIKERRGN